MTAETNVVLPTESEVQPMPAETLTALQASIAHWEAVAAGTEIATGSDDCALCEKFYPESRKDWDGDKQINCKGCPVDQSTNGNGCLGTPCGRYFENMEIHEVELAHDHATAEVEFLKSLLPEEVDPTPWCSADHPSEASCDCGAIDRHD